MSQETREQVLGKLRRRYVSAGLKHKKKLLQQAQDLLGYHRKSAIRALRAEPVMRGPVIITGRPVKYEPGLLLPFLRPIWQASTSGRAVQLVLAQPRSICAIPTTPEIGRWDFGIRNFRAALAPSGGRGATSEISP